MKCDGLRGSDAQVTQPAPHLPRRPLGEGDSQDLARGDMTGCDQMGDAMGNCARLACSGPGEHTDGAARSGDGGTPNSASNRRLRSSRRRLLAGVRPGLHDLPGDGDRPRQHQP
ncbi:Uncharacterised protein [Mycobacteroides abscessus subsp. abscessus]|nr:Uncharacterised protein [Mycobacteroides abscessus subsp. abscessus]